MKSLFTQKMTNWQMNFSLLFETLLACFFCYTPGMQDVLGLHPVRFTWWLAALPFALLIFIYDELRKFILRRSPSGSWVERETYY